MNSNQKYLFKSDRLGFRTWDQTDLADLVALNSDEEVMEHFPNVLTEKESADLLVRLQNHYTKRGYTYFATDILFTGELIGFIGLAYQEYNTEFNPSTDIGWRLKKSAWGMGYATEGAKRCLKFGFEVLKLERIISVCTLNNFKSEHVMKKIGMSRKGEFKHPELDNYPDYQQCLWYEIKKS